MINETDLPCSDCGDELVERTIDIQELAPASSDEGQVTVASCPACGATYYPEETLSLLAGEATTDTRPPRGD